jgi:hypothetical protein
MVVIRNPLVLLKKRSRSRPDTLVLAFLIQKGYFSPVVSAVFSVSIIPVISFLASRLWGFK